MGILISSVLLIVLLQGGWTPGGGVKGGMFLRKDPLCLTRYDSIPHLYQSARVQLRGGEEGLVLVVLYLSLHPRERLT